jgi:hypothetical protein
MSGDVISDTSDVSSILLTLKSSVHTVNLFSTNNYFVEQPKTVEISIILIAIFYSSFSIFKISSVTIPNQVKTKDLKEYPGNFYLLLKIFLIVFKLIIK